MAHRTGFIRFLKDHRGRLVGSMDPSPPGTFPTSTFSIGVQETLVQRGVAEWIDDPAATVTRKSRTPRELPLPASDRMSHSMKE